MSSGSLPSGGSSRFGLGGGRRTLPTLCETQSQGRYRKKSEPCKGKHVCGLFWVLGLGDTEEVLVWHARVVEG